MIEVGVGDSIPSGDVIARVLGGSIPLHDIRRAFLLGTERTMEQDPKFALRLLADVAIKALSPAINDPTTAVQALDQIQAMRKLRDLLQNLEQAVPAERRAVVEDRLLRLDAACEQSLQEADRADARIPDPQGLGHSRAA